MKEVKAIINRLFAKLKEVAEAEDLSLPCYITNKPPYYLYYKDELIVCEGKFERVMIEKSLLNYETCIYGSYDDNFFMLKAYPHNGLKGFYKFKIYFRGVEYELSADGKIDRGGCYEDKR